MELVKQTDEKARGNTVPFPLIYFAGKTWRDKISDVYLLHLITKDAYIQILIGQMNLTKGSQLLQLKLIAD